MQFDVSTSTVLVTGAGGFIGSHLTAALMARGATVHVVLRPGATPPRFATLDLQPLTHFADMTKTGVVPDLIDRVRPDVVFNLAVCRANDAPDMLDQTNVVAALSVLEACQYPGFHRMVTIGSSLEHQPVITTPYAHSRERAATALRERAESLNIPLTHLRTYYVYGSLQDKSKLIPAALRNVGKQTSLPLVPDNLRRDYVEVGDLVRACIAAVEADLPCYCIADIATGAEWSARDVIELLEQLTGTSIPTHSETTLTRAWDKDHWEPDLAPARTLFGWEPQVTLREGLRALVADVRSVADAP